MYTPQIQETFDFNHSFLPVGQTSKRSILEDAQSLKDKGYSNELIKQFIVDRLSKLSDAPADGVEIAATHKVNLLDFLNQTKV